MTTKDLKQTDERMERIIELTREMIGETDQIKIKDMRTEIAKTAGSVRGTMTYYLTLED